MLHWIGTAQRSQRRHSTRRLRARRGKGATFMLTADYITGLTDGEGSFCVFIRRPAKTSWNTRVECHYYVKMRQDELPLLRRVKRFFGCGRISYQKEYRENQQDNYRYQVSNLYDLQRSIIPFFRRHRLYSPNRKRDFRIFQKVVRMVARKQHHTKDGLREIIRLKNQMHA